MKPRTILTIVLLVFMTVSVVALVAREFAAPSAAAGFRPPSAGVLVVYFHGHARCAACLRVEDYSRQAVETAYAQAIRDGRLHFAVVDYETPGNEHFIKDFDLPGNCLLVAEYQNGRAVRHELLPEVWALTETKDPFFQYVQAEVQAFAPDAK